MDLNHIVDSLQDIFDEYDIIPPGDGGMDIDESFYSFGGANHEVCISVSRLNKKVYPNWASDTNPSPENIRPLVTEIYNMIPIIEARTGYKLAVSVVKGRNYSHIFIKEKI